MGNIYKLINKEDVTTVRGVYHESVPIDGAIINGSSVYGTYPDNTNVQRMYHGMFQRVYDYPYTSSSSNHIFDITLGIASDSDIYSVSFLTDHSFASGYDSGKDSFKDKKNNMYNLLSQYLMGYDQDGNIRQFPALNFTNVEVLNAMDSVFAISISRLLQKEGVKKGSFSMILGMNPNGLSSSSTPFDDFDWDTGGSATSSYVQIYDADGNDNYRTDSPVGEYGVLYVKPVNDPSGSPHSDPSNDSAISGSLLDSDNKVPVGYIFYQAGVIILSSRLFMGYVEKVSGVSCYGYIRDDALNATEHLGIKMLYDSTGDYATLTDPTDDYYDMIELLVGYEDGGATDDEDLSIDNFADAFRQRVYSISFVNEVEVNSTVYLCRLNHNDFNYSSNPTFTENSKIVVKDTSKDEPITYITTVGLYSADNALLAVGKLSEPLKKTPSTSFTLRARIDY